MLFQLIDSLKMKKQQILKKPPDCSEGRGRCLCDNQANFMAVNSLAKRLTPLWILSMVLRLGLRLP